MGKEGKDSSDGWRTEGEPRGQGECDCGVETAPKGRQDPTSTTNQQAPLRVPSPLPEGVSMTPFPPHPPPSPLQHTSANTEFMT